MRNFEVKRSQTEICGTDATTTSRKMSELKYVKAIGDGSGRRRWPTARVENEGTKNASLSAGDNRKSHHHDTTTTGRMDRRADNSTQSILLL